jgi:tRNA (cytidine32/guanosine34-2'-O)-methyltransferase
MLTFHFNYRYNPANEFLGASALVVPFVACGDLSGFDSDKSYPLQLSGESSTYVYRDPVQPPINPNYHSYQKRFAKNSSECDAEDINAV